MLSLAGVAVPAAVWLLGMLTPPRTGLTTEYVAVYTALLAGMVVLERTAPRADAALWRRGTWLAAELVLCFFVVRVQGSLYRPTLIYLLPTSRALLMFGERNGLVASLAVWGTYSANVGLALSPEQRLGEFPNYLSLFLAPFAVAVVMTLAALRQAADRRHVERLYDELRTAHEELQLLHQRAREAAVAEERNRLAREIHDSLAHYLTVINVQLEAAEKLGSNQPRRALDQVLRARRLTLECLQEVRRSVAALRAATLEELSLPSALQKLAAEFAEHTGITVEVEVALPDDLRLAPETALALYRVAQEGLTNVHRHARSARARLTVVVRDGVVELAVQDEGVGPGEEEKGERGGFGLLGLRERVELLGGRLAFGQGQPSGSRLAAVLPLNSA